MSAQTLFKKSSAVFLSFALLISSLFLGAMATDTSAVQFGTQDFEDLEDLSGFSLRNDWELSEAYNHTPEGGKSAAMRIDKDDNSEMGRPRMVINIGGVNTVVKRGNSYTVSFWLYLPESEASSITLKYYIASIASSDKVTSDNKADHKIEGTGEISTFFASGAWQQFVVEIPSLEGISENNYLEIGITDEASWESGYISKQVYIDDISIIDNESGEIQTEYGPQDYEEIAVGNYPQYNTDGIRGNGSGREVSDEQNHTENGSHSVKLNMNDNRETNAPRTVVNFDGADFRVRTNTAYQITFWAYSPENLSVTYRLGTSGSTTNLWNNPNWTEAMQTVEMKAGEWQEIKFTVLSFSASNYLTLAATFDEASADNAKPLYIDDVAAEIIVETDEAFGTQDFEDLEDLSDFSLRNDWELSEAYNHTPEGGKSAGFRIDQWDNSQMGRPRMVINIDGVNTVVKRGNSYTVSFWLYLPESEASSVTLKYYVASMASLDKINSNNSADHKLEGTGEISTFFAAGAWQQFVVEIPSLEGMAENNYLEIGLTDDVCWNDGYKSRSLYIDDISVTDNEAGEIQTEYGPQDYEEIAVGNYPQSNTDGIRGNGSGREVSDEQNHTENGSHSVKLNMNDNRETNAPRTVVNFDGADFRVRTNTAYQITFWAYSPTDLTVDYRLGTTSNPTNFWAGSNWTEAKQTVEMKAGEWQEIKFTVLSFSASNYLTLAASFSNSSTTNAKPLYIDDVTVKLLTDLPEITFNSMGGSEVSPKPVAQGEPIGTLPQPERDGYVFDGWFNEDYSIYYSSGTVFPDVSGLTLYAKWTEIASEAKSYSSGFEASEYTLPPYLNDGIQKSTYVNMTESAAWLSDTDVTYSGKGAMRLINDPFVNYNGSSFQCFSLMNEDASRFMVVKGQRYRISYYYYATEPDSAHSYISAIVSLKNADGGINASEQVVDRQVIHGAMDDWVRAEAYFEADETGFVYFAIAARTSTTEASSRYHTALIDNVEVELLGDDYVTVSYVKDGTVCDKYVGKTGEPLQTPVLSTKTNYEFTGWYKDASLSTPLKDFTYPAESITLYAGYESADYENGTQRDYTKGVTMSFEETELVRNFYTTTQHRSNASDASWSEIELILNDPENARTGNNYIKINPVEWHYADLLLSFYDAEGKYGNIYLEPGETYKISYYVKPIDELADVSFNLYLTDPSSNSVNQMSVDSIDIIGVDLEPDSWAKVEHTVTNDTNQRMSVALRNYGAYNDCLIDDVTVYQLSDVVITFDSMGGSAVEPMTVTTGMIAEAPIDPVRSGYDFAGWYTDKEYKNRFDFETQEITGPVTLYAAWQAWEPDDEHSGSNTENNNGGYNNLNDMSDTEEDVIDNGAAPLLIDADPVSRTSRDTSNTDKTGGIDAWVIAVIVAAAAAAGIGAGLLCFILVRRKKRSNTQ